MIFVHFCRPISLTVAKCWDPEPILPSFEPRCKLIVIWLIPKIISATCFITLVEPIRPIDPSAWVMQTNQHQHQGTKFKPLTTPTSSSHIPLFLGDYGNYGQYGHRPFTGSPTLSTMTSNSSPSLNSSLPESDRKYGTVRETVLLFLVCGYLGTAPCQSQIVSVGQSERLCCCS